MGAGHVPLERQRKEVEAKQWVTSGCHLLSWRGLYLLTFPSRTPELRLAERVPLEDPRTTSVGGLSGLHTSKDGELSTRPGTAGTERTSQSLGRPEGKGTTESQPGNFYASLTPWPWCAETNSFQQRGLQALSRGREARSSRPGFQVVEEKISTIPPLHTLLPRVSVTLGCEG